MLKHQNKKNENEIFCNKSSFGYDNFNNPITSRLDNKKPLSKKKTTLNPNSKGEKKYSIKYSSNNQKNILQKKKILIQIQIFIIIIII